MKTILGLETSCDETAAAIVQKQDNRVIILSNVVASSASIQAKYGGVIPEQAAREQLKSILPVIQESIQSAGLEIEDIDAIALTQGPGLIGSLLVGVETAKVLATIWNKPLIPVNHLMGHFYANWFSETPPIFPCIGLLVSGGHSDIIYLQDHNLYEYLGGTRDDAAGECFDKSARLLGIPYPGGPLLSKIAESGDPNTFNLPRPMIGADNFDFSFSGLKTAVVNLVAQLTNESTRQGQTKIPDQTRADLCASLEEAITDCLIKKVVKAAQFKGVDQIIVSGGVAANKTLRRKLIDYFHAGAKQNIKVYFPSPELCTDNAVMIATAGFFNKPLENPLALEANPNLSLSRSESLLLTKSKINRF